MVEKVEKFAKVNGDGGVVGKERRKCASNRWVWMRDEENGGGERPMEIKIKMRVAVKRVVVQPAVGQWD